MKIFYTASKDSYGTAFSAICNSLEELKEAIYHHNYMFEDNLPKYSEELVQSIIKDEGFTLYSVNLHEEERIVFDEYDGQSWFNIRKINQNILSTAKRIKQ